MEIKSTFRVKCFRKNEVEDFLTEKILSLKKKLNIL